MTAPCVLVVHEPWSEVHRVIGGRTMLAFENAATTEYTLYPFGPTEPYKTAIEARAAFLEGLLEESSAGSRRSV